MPRSMTPAMAAALSAPVVRPCILASVGFATSTVCAWSGLGPLTWNSQTFEGIGDMATISSATESSTVEAQGMTITLSGVSAANVTDAIEESRRLKPVTIWLGCLDASGALIADPIVLFSGVTDKCSVVDGGDSCTITLNIESFLLDLNRPVYMRYDADSAALARPLKLAAQGLPSTTVDTGFRYVATIQEMTLFWGVSPTSSNNI